MATEQQMIQTWDRLRSSEGFPGLDITSIVDNYVDVEFKDALYSCKTQEERRAMKNNFVEYYITGPGKTFIQQTIQDIKDMYRNVKDMLDDLRESITQITASNAIPAVVVAGSATGTPNPAYTIIDNAQKKKTVSAILNTASEYFGKLISLALLIHLVLPDAILSYGDVIGSLKELVR